MVTITCQIGRDTTYFIPVLSLLRDKDPAAVKATEGHWCATGDATHGTGMEGGRCQKWGPGGALDWQNPPEHWRYGGEGGAEIWSFPISAKRTTPTTTWSATTPSTATSSPTTTARLLWLPIHLPLPSAGLVSSSFLHICTFALCTLDFYTFYIYIYSFCFLVCL